MAKRRMHAVGGYPPGPGQTITNGSWTGPGTASQDNPPMPQPTAGEQSAPPVFGKRTTPPPVKAAGGMGCAGVGAANGLDGAMMAHADKMHPVRGR